MSPATRPTAAEFAPEAIVAASARPIVLTAAAPRQRPAKRENDRFTARRDAHRVCACFRLRLSVWSIAGLEALKPCGWRNEMRDSGRVTFHSMCRLYSAENDEYVDDDTSFNRSLRLRCGDDHPHLAKLPGRISLFVDCRHCMTEGFDLAQV